MNILSEIRNDHLFIRRSLGSLQRTSRRQATTREKGFAKLSNFLTTHTEVEVEIFYRILLQDVALRRHILECQEEHHLFDLLVGEMSTLSVGDERWDAKLRVLHEALERHIEVEESKIFMMARKLIPDELVLKEMGLYYRTLFHERTSRPSLTALASRRNYPSEIPRL